MRLLCVEDENALRGDISEYLRMHHYEVDEADSGEAAIEQLNKNHYDLVLCDIKMPRMDGYELLKQVRRENHLTFTPFLFLSALNERDDKIHAHVQGCDGFLTKPIDFAVLDATLRAHIERQRQRDFIHYTIHDAMQRHVLTALEDALSGPVANASVIINYLRTTVPTLTPSALDEHLQRAQNSLNAHAVDLHLMHSALSMQVCSPVPVHEAMLVEDLIQRAVEESQQQRPDARIRYKAAPSTGQMLYGDLRALQRAMAGLMAVMPLAHDSSQVVRCSHDGNDIHLILCDHPGMFESLDDFIAIDTATNLIALSAATRQRVIALSYALQVAYAHKGRLELKLWSDDALALRFVLPQPMMDNHLADLKDNAA